MTVEEYIEEHRKRVANMTLAQARDLIAKLLSHSDMELEFDKAVQMLLDCADEKINGEWIPVTERLPKKDGLYLVSVKNDNLRRYSKTCWYSDKNWFARHDVVAWQPLPQPYKAESEGVEE